MADRQTNVRTRALLPFGQPSDNRPVRSLPMTLARKLLVPAVLLTVAAGAALPGAADARKKDRDGDGLSNRSEKRKHHTNPRRADTDRDRLKDGYEVRKSHTNPRRKDTDRDGLRDRYELRKSHTNPRRKDTDGDGINDGREVRLGLDPLRKNGGGGGGGPKLPVGPGCMPDPSRCGLPDVETTGVTPGVPLTAVNGSVTLSTPGMVYENRIVTGTITVNAPNVTIRNVRLMNTSPHYGIKAFDISGLLLDHVEIDLGGNYDAKGIAFDGYTARNVFFHNGADCAHFGNDVVIEDSLCVIGPDANDDGWPDSTAFCDGPEHHDGFQSDGGGNIVLRRNTIRLPCGGTSAILMSTNTDDISNVVIQDNLMAGGGYTLYCNAGPDVRNETVTGNRFSRIYWPDAGYWGATTGCNEADTYSGSVWDEDNTPLN
jgi:hypothetical protein